MTFDLFCFLGKFKISAVTMTKGGPIEMMFVVSLWRLNNNNNNGRVRLTSTDHEVK